MFWKLRLVVRNDLKTLRSPGSRYHFVHHCWSCHLVTLAVKIGNPTAPVVKGHVVRSLQKKTRNTTGCAAILIVSALKLPQSYLNIASPHAA